jgi:hypothetical protein
MQGVHGQEKKQERKRKTQIELTTWESRLSHKILPTNQANFSNLSLQSKEQTF